MGETVAKRAPSWRTDKRSASDRGYGPAWRKARDRFLALHPLCVYCKEQGLITAATVVDHKIPHRGDQTLFWDEGNWQSLCKPHHDGTKAKEESRGVKIGGDAHGQPLDPNHHWNR